MSNTAFPKYQGSVIVGGSDLVLINSQSANNDSSIVFNNLPALHTFYLYFFDVYSTVNDDDLRLRTSNDNAVSFDSGANDYSYSIYAVSFPTIFGANQFTETINSSYIKAAHRLGNVDTNSSTGLIVFQNPSNSTPPYTTCFGNIQGRTYTGDDIDYYYDLGGARKAAQSVNAFEFSFASGNIAAGEFKIYGT